MMLPARDKATGAERAGGREREFGVFTRDKSHRCCLSTHSVWRTHALFTTLQKRSLKNKTKWNMEQKCDHVPRSTISPSSVTPGQQDRMVLRRPSSERRQESLLLSRDGSKNCRYTKLAFTEAMDTVRTSSDDTV